MPELYTRNPNTKCVVCNKPIYKRPVETARNNGRVFCSMSCYGISCRKESPCPVCGKLILSGLNRVTCGKVCSNKHRVGIRYKLNRPRDIVFSQRSIKARLTLERGTSCEKCGYNRLEILQVHHKDRDRTNNDLRNLELICPNCHYEEHHLSRGR